MKRVAVVPWPDRPNCYICISGKLRRERRYGEKWYVDHDHEEQTTKHEFGDKRTEPLISFTYARDGVAAEWDGDAGPIQLWFKCERGFKEENGYSEAREHWLWPFAYGRGHWSQLAVDRADLPDRFNRGDWDGIFAELQRWVESRLPDQAVGSAA